MRERVKKWIRKLFRTKYIIVRNEIILWQLIYVNRTESKYILASSELLSEVSFSDRLKFSKAMKEAYKTRAIWSWILMKILINRNGRDFKYKRIKAVDVVFLTDLTGLTEN
jgi:hypothetical protein